MVLVVDDDDAIRHAVRDILELIDVQTLDASNGEEALSIFTNHRNVIAAVLLDVQLPTMSGEQVYLALREEDDSVPIILSSGLDDLDMLDNAESHPCTSFLRKPYAIDTLLAAIQAATS